VPAGQNVDDCSDKFLEMKPKSFIILTEMAEDTVFILDLKKDKHNK
jgi:hypothetical protein